MSAHGLVGFGYYPDLPLTFRRAGGQWNYGGGHGMGFLPGSVPKDHLPPFFRETAHETGRVDGCTETALAMVFAWAVGDNSISVWQTREELQDAIHAQSSSVGPSQLQTAAKIVFKIETGLTTSWSQITNILGSKCWVADPLGYGWKLVSTSSMRGFFSGSHPQIIGPNRAVVVTQTEEDPLHAWYETVKPYPASRVTVPKGSYTFQRPDTAASARYAGPLGKDWTFYCTGQVEAAGKTFLVYPLNNGGFACVPADAVTAVKLGDLHATEDVTAAVQAAVKPLQAMIDNAKAALG